MNERLAAATDAVEAAEELERVEGWIATVRDHLAHGQIGGCPAPSFSDRLLADYAETSAKLRLPMGLSARLTWSQQVTLEDVHAIEAWLPAIIAAMREGLPATVVAADVAIAEALVEDEPEEEVEP